MFPRCLQSSPLLSDTAVSQPGLDYKEIIKSIISPDPAPPTINFPLGLAIPAILFKSTQKLEIAKNACYFFIQWVRDICPKRFDAFIVVKKLLHNTSSRSALNRKVLCLRLSSIYVNEADTKTGTIMKRSVLKGDVPRDIGSNLDRPSI